VNANVVSERLKPWPIGFRLNVDVHVTPGQDADAAAAAADSVGL